MYAMRRDGESLRLRLCRIMSIYLLTRLPTDNPSQIMKRIKGRASHHLRQEFPELLKLPTLWTPSYFVSTAGNLCTETVKRYIAQQRQ